MLSKEELPKDWLWNDIDGVNYLTLVIINFFNKSFTNTFICYYNIFYRQRTSIYQIIVNEFLYYLFLVFLILKNLLIENFILL